MAYKVDWYIENEIIYMHYSGATTADELRESLLQVRSLIDSSPRPLVHVITDVGDVTDPLSLRDSMQIVRDIGPNERAGWQITLREPSLMVKMGITFGTTIFKVRARTFDTMEEVVEFLKSRDDAIHWENADTSVISG